MSFRIAGWLVKITFGMAVFEDFKGLFFTIQSLRATLFENQKLLHRIEFVVVDSGHKPKISDRIRQWLAKIPNSKYVKYTGPDSTSAPRDLVFASATGDIVICVDSHIVLVPSAIPAIDDHFRYDRNRLDIVTGPLLFDAFTTIATHFNTVWGGGMRGQWADAWRAPDGMIVEARQSGPNCILHRAMDGEEVPVMPTSGMIPDGPIPWNRYVQALWVHGYMPIGMNQSDEAFEIPAMGLGLFACRRDVWPKFCAGETTALTGFGGEEHNIHEVFRQMGGRAVCIPAVKWVHEFRDDNDPPPYSAKTYQKVRNNVLWHHRTGKPLDEIREHFVESPVNGRNMMSLEDWDHLIADPVNHTEGISKDNPQRLLKQPPKDMTNVQQIFAWAHTIKRDLDQHLDRLRAIGMQCATVTEFTKRRESTIAFAASSAQVTSYQAEFDPIIAKLGVHKIIPLPHPYAMTDQYTNFISHLVIDPTDALFIDTLHDGNQLNSELAAFASHVSKWIIIRGTELFGQEGEIKGSPGLIWAIDLFIDESPEWQIVYQTPIQSGLTVISRLGERTVAFGPGTELKGILSRLGLNPKAGCSCEAIAREMDSLGPDGCALAIDRFVTTIDQNKEKWGWNVGHAISTGAKAIMSGLALKINPIDPIRSVIKLAIAKSRKQDSPAPRFFLYEDE